MTRVGSLCTGYGGLDMAVESVIGGDLAWVADIDPGASAILACRYPSVPNLHDITVTDWAAIEPVDVLTAGFPCQDVSCAGGRAGLRAGNRTGVWAHVARAIDTLRPSLVVLENVRGLLSAGADSDLEWCPWCMGDADPESALRALGAVLGDLAGLGFDAEWAVVSAADVGAPHRRERVFIAAWPDGDTANGRRPDRRHDRSEQGPAGEGDPAPGHPRGVHRGTTADAERHGREGRRSTDGQGETGRPGTDAGRCGPARSDPTPQDADRTASGERRQSAPGQAPGGWPRADAGGPGGAPVAADPIRPELAREREPQRREPPASGDSPDAAANPERDGQSGRPAAVAGTPDEQGQGSRTAPAGRGTSSAPDAECGASDGRTGEPLGGPHRRDAADRDSAGRIEWGPYELAIRRWEHVTGRPAPRPTEPGRTGERLSPRFVEWLMGLPDGWVTDVPGLTRNAQLKALGNGVVPQQAAAALRLLLPAVSERAA